MAKRRIMYMPDFRIERDLRNDGFRLVAGIDEAGRGAWAGPLYASAVILPLDNADTIHRLNREHVRDGKRISPNRRKALREIIIELATAVGVGYATAREIDQQGVVPATLLAMERALQDLYKKQKPDYLLIDYYQLPDIDIPQQHMPRGERAARCIAAASIVAKVTRDEHMLELDAEFPDYGFAQHKGYGTAKHRQMLKKHRPLPDIHRYSFRPISTLNGGAGRE